MRGAATDEKVEDLRPVVIDPDEIAAETDPIGIGTGTAPTGTYVLRYSTETELTAEVGALGPQTFDAGVYAYVGSAFGSNGLGRVSRHRRVAVGEHDVQHWHVDYFGSHPRVSLDAVIAVPEADIECQLATRLRESLGVSTVPVDGFGASDCNCRSHLIAAPDGEALASAIADAITQLVRE